MSEEERNSLEYLHMYASMLAVEEWLAEQIRNNPEKSYWDEHKRRMYSHLGVDADETT